MREEYGELLADEPLHLHELAGALGPVEAPGEHLVQLVVLGVGPRTTILARPAVFRRADLGSSKVHLGPHAAFLSDPTKGMTLLAGPDLRGCQAGRLDVEPYSPPGVHQDQLNALELGPVDPLEVEPNSLGRGYDFP